MQFPVVIGLHRSFLQRAIVFFLLLVAISVALFGPFAIWVSVVLLLLVLAGSSMLLQQLNHPVHSLMLSAEGKLSVRFSGKETEFFPVTILPSATVHSWLTVLRLEYEGHSLNLMITPDAIDAEAFRRLRVWLRWQATFLDVDAAA